MLKSGKTHLAARFILALIIAIVGLSKQIKADEGYVEIKLLIYSGLEDPMLRLDPIRSANLIEKIRNTPENKVYTGPKSVIPSKLGYKGARIFHHFGQNNTMISIYSGNILIGTDEYRLDRNLEVETSIVEFFREADLIDAQRHRLIVTSIQRLRDGLR